MAGLQRADWRPSLLQSVVNGVPENLEKTNLSRLTPRLSLIWQPGTGDVLKLIYGQGFRFPTIFERYYTDGETQVPNPGIAPEVITSTQFTWSRKWSSHWSTQAALSLFQQENTIVSSLVQATGMAQYQNASAPNRGRVVEVETAWHQGGTELSGGVGSYRWTCQGAPLDNTSPWLAVFKASQRVGDWSAAGEARYVAPRENNASWVPAPVEVPANWTLRCSLRRNFDHGWGQVSVEDLTNSRRRDLVAPEYQPTGWMAADGRTVVGVIGVRF